MHAANIDFDVNFGFSSSHTERRVVPPAKAPDRPSRGTAKEAPMTHVSAAPAVEPISLGERLRQSARALGDAVAMRSIRDRDDVTEISWSELDRRSEALAHRLLDMGVDERPATVVLITRNAVEHAVYAYGAWKAGQTVLCLSPKLGSIEGRIILDRLGRTISLGADLEWDTSERVDLSSPDDTTPVADRVARPMLLLASGGSTGVPKLIDAIGNGQFRPGDLLGGLGQALKRRPRAKAFVCTPLSHGAGAATAYMGTFEECEVTSLERFDPDVALWAIDRYGLEQITLVPTMMDRMARARSFPQARLTSIRSFNHTGAIVDPEIKQRWIDAIGAEKVIDVYGSTESVGHFVITGDEWLTHRGSVGRAVNCDTRIIGENGEDQKPGSVGEVFVRPRTATVDPSTKYIGSDLKMKSFEDFVSVGDLGYLDEDGFLYVVGRTDDLIITGGANVYPDEVEIAIRSIDGVADCVVVGQPDADMGQRVHAVVAMADGVPAPGLDELRERLRGALIDYKMPRSLEIVTAIERTDAGKIRRKSFVNHAS
jgi:bile acid-coenzyme A ligase